MALLSLFQLLLVLLLFRGIIKLPIHRVIIMRLPIFLHGLEVLSLPLFSYLLLMVLFVCTCDDIVLFFVVVDKVLLALLR